MTEETVVQFEPDAKARKRARRAAYLKTYRVENREQLAVRSKTWRAKNKDRNKLSVRRSRLKGKYGITTEEFDAILLSQGGRCKICRTDAPGFWCVDHSHATDHVRGILCNPCNLALGHVKDTPAILKAMIRYLYDS